MPPKKNWMWKKINPERARAYDERRNTTGRPAGPPVPKKQRTDSDDQEDFAGFTHDDFVDAVVEQAIHDTVLPGGPNTDEDELPEDTSDAPQVADDVEMADDQNHSSVNHGGALAGTDDGEQTVGNSAGGRGASGGRVGGNMRGNATLPRGKQQPPFATTKTYHKQYSLKLRTDNIEYRKVPTTADNGGAFFKYPIYELPWEYLGMYLTQDEIAEITCNSSRVLVEEVEVAIHNFTAVLNFEIGGSVASVGNNNVGFRASIMKNMRGHRSGYYNQHPSEIIKNVFWGVHAKNLPESNAFVSTNIAQLGAWLVPRNYNLRFLHTAASNPVNPTVSEPSQSFRQYNETAFNWNAYKQERRNVSMNEGFWHKQTYRPKNGYIDGRNFIFMNQQDWNANAAESGLIQGSTFMLSEARKTHGITQMNPDLYYPRTDIIPVSSLNVPQYRNPQFVKTHLPTNAPGTRWNFGQDSDATVPEGNSEQASREQFVQLPAADNYDPTLFHQMLIENKSKFKSRGNSIEDSVQPSLAIGFDIMVNEDGQNTTIPGWMEVFIETKCTVKIYDGQCAPCYPQGGSGGYGKNFPMPFFTEPYWEYANPIWNSVGQLQMVGRNRFTEQTLQQPEVYGQNGGVTVITQVKDDLAMQNVLPAPATIEELIERRQSKRIRDKAATPESSTTNNKKKRLTDYVNRI